MGVTRIGVSLRVSRQVKRALTVMALTATAAGAQSNRMAGPDTRDTRSTLAREMVSAHNAVRAEVDVAPLQWSDELAAIARKWAATLLARRQFLHSDSGYGENLFAITGGSVTPATVVGHWASESRNFDYRSNACRGLCGHYTQIVWRESRKVGCAMARGGGREVWVCDYDPPGNWLGQRPY